MKSPNRTSRVLVVCPDLPYPLSSGSHVRVYSLIQALRRRFSVTLFSLLQGLETPSDVEAVRNACDRLILHHASNKKGMLRRTYHRVRFECRHLLNGLPAHVYYNNLTSIQHHLQEILQSDMYDIVIQEYWYTSLHLHRFAPQALRVVDTHDVHFQRMALFPPPGLFRMLERDLRIYAENEIETLRHFHILIALSEGDKETFSRHLQNEIQVVPTGVDMDRFPPTRRAEPVPGRIGFFGAISNPANLDALLHFYWDVFPRIYSMDPSVHLCIIGGHVPPVVSEIERKDHRVKVTGYVADLQKELQTLQLAVMPLRKTSGIRGRIYEIMASQVPLVAYPEATQGMNLEAGRHYVEVRSQDELAERIVHVLKNSQASSRMTKAAYALVESRYSHQATYDDFCSKLEQRVLQRRNAHL